MSKLARILVLGAMLATMFLGGTAHAQDRDASSQRVGVTQQDPAADQPSATDPTTPQEPTTTEEPATTEEPTTTADPGQAPTTTTRPPVVRPTSLPVTVSPRAGRPGITVTVRADLRGCLRPDSGHGFFQDAEGRDVDGLAKWLVSEGVSGGRWYTGRYRITNTDAAGLGQFGMVCDQAILKAIHGFANFRVQPSKSPVPVRVTPQAAGRGTTVKITAEVGWCQRIHIWFYDRKSDGLTMAGGAKLIESNPPVEAGKVTASYTLTHKDAIGPARFRVVCGSDIDNARVGEASFRVQPSRSPVLVWVTPRAGGPGTVVRITAEVGQCRYHSLRLLP